MQFLIIFYFLVDYFINSDCFKTGTEFLKQFADHGKVPSKDHEIAEKLLSDCGELVLKLLWFHLVELPLKHFKEKVSFKTMNFWSSDDFTKMFTKLFLI